MAGKLNGVIPATTPKGNLIVIVSISLAIFGNDSPNCSEVMLQQCSTTSKEAKQNNNYQCTKHNKFSTLATFIKIFFLVVSYFLEKTLYH